MRWEQQTVLTNPTCHDFPHILQGMNSCLNVVVVVVVVVVV